MENKAVNRMLKISALRFNPQEPGSVHACRRTRSKKRKA
jgi:hypothetical protein